MDRDRRNWFEARRACFERRMIEAFLQQNQGVVDLYLLCRQATSGGKGRQPLAPELIESLTTHLAEVVGSADEPGPLWQLKDLCHRLWPEDRDGADSLGALLDWTIGSAFHQMMKLKENVYLLNRYDPAGRALKQTIERRAGGARSLGIPVRLAAVDHLPTRIGADVLDDMERVALLFGQASWLLRSMMVELVVNPLVVRLLIEEEPQVQELWQESLIQLFTDMFDGRPAMGFCLAGRSYLQGQWYYQALQVYERALGLESGCDEARVKVAQLRRIQAEGSAPFQEVP